MLTRSTKDGVEQVQQLIPGLGFCVQLLSLQWLDKTSTMPKSRLTGLFVKQSGAIS